MRARQQKGYNSNLANQYTTSKKPFVFLTSESEIKKIWVDGKITDEIKGYNHWFIQDTLNPFQVTLPNDYTDEFNLLDNVSFELLEAVEVKNKVYFRASKVISYDK